MAYGEVIIRFDEVSFSYGPYIPILREKAPYSNSLPKR
jgi:hypothetical protein